MVAGRSVAGPPENWVNRRGAEEGGHGRRGERKECVYTRIWESRVKGGEVRGKAAGSGGCSERVWAITWVEDAVKGKGQWGLVR